MAKTPSVAASGELGITVHENGLRFEVHARPKASRSAICGAREGARDVILVRGATGKSKLIEVRGLTIDEVRNRLREATPVAK